MQMKIKRRFEILVIQKSANNKINHVVSEAVF